MLAKSANELDLDKVVEPQNLGVFNLWQLGTPQRRSHPRLSLRRVAIPPEPMPDRDHRHLRQPGRLRHTVDADSKQAAIHESSPPPGPSSLKGWLTLYGTTRVARR